MMMMECSTPNEPNIKLECLQILKTNDYVTEEAQNKQVTWTEESQIKQNQTRLSIKKQPSIIFL